MKSMSPIISSPGRGASTRDSFATRSVTNEADAEVQIALSLETAKEQFLDAKIAQLCTERTVGQYRWVLQRFSSWAAGRGIHDVEEITPQLVREFLTLLIRRRRASSYIHGHARVIRTFFRFLEAEGLVESNPMARVAMPRVERKILPTFTKDEVQRLLAACSNKRERAIVLVLIDTGVRASELVHLTLADVDLDAGRIVVRQGKGRRDRLVFVRPQTGCAINDYLAQRAHVEPGALLFPSVKTGKPLKPNGLLLLCRRLGRRAEVENCHPHKFRRTFATWSLRAGMDIHALQRLMGHADLDVLLHYLDLGEADLAEAHRLYGPVDSLLGPTAAHEAHA
jgi:integrase/recombinase XerD